MNQVKKIINRKLFLIKPFHFDGKQLNKNFSVKHYIYFCEITSDDFKQETNKKNPIYVNRVKYLKFTLFFALTKQFCFKILFFWF